MKLLIFSANSYRAATKVDSNGRPVKGRGIMVRLLFSYSLFDCFYLFFLQRYTGKSRSRSRTPPHWRSAAEERKRYVELNESRKQSSSEQTNSNDNTDT